MTPEEQQTALVNVVTNLTLAISLLASYIGHETTIAILETMVKGLKEQMRATES